MFPCICVQSWSPFGVCTCAPATSVFPLKCLKEVPRLLIPGTPVHRDRRLDPFTEHQHGHLQLESRECTPHNCSGWSIYWRVRRGVSSSSRGSYMEGRNPENHLLGWPRWSSIPTDAGVRFHLFSWALYGVCTLTQWLTFISAGTIQLIFVSAGPAQLIFVSAGPIQLIFVSAGPAQLTFVFAGYFQFDAARAPPRARASRAPPRACASRAPPRVSGTRAPTWADRVRSGPGAHGFRSVPGAHGFRSVPGAHALRSVLGAPAGPVQLSRAPAGSVRLSRAPAGSVRLSRAPAGSVRLSSAPAGSVQLSWAAAGSVRLPRAPSDHASREPPGDEESPQ